MATESIPNIGRPLQQIIDANGAVQKTVLGMNVEMDKIRNVGSCHRMIYFLMG